MSTDNSSQKFRMKMVSFLLFSFVLSLTRSYSVQSPRSEPPNITTEYEISEKRTTDDIQPNYDLQKLFILLSDKLQNLSKPRKSVMTTLYKAHKNQEWHPLDKRPAAFHWG